MKGDNFAQIGFGPVNPHGVYDGLEAQYDVNNTSGKYDPTPLLDSSHKIGAYDPSPNPPGPTPPDPKPVPPGPTPQPDPDPTPKNDNTLTYVVVGILSFALLCMIIFIIWYCHKKRKPKTFRMFSDNDTLKAYI